MMCKNDGTHLEPKENGFVCPVCGAKEPYCTKTKHETKRHEKAAKKDGAATFVSRD
jgi:uncharacterized Zn finger protein (UPF0148 family)